MLFLAVERLRLKYYALFKFQERRDRDKVNKRRMLKFGREAIYTSYKEVDRNNVLDILKDSIPIHRINSMDIVYLYRYYKGDQPVLKRQKQVRSEINNKIVENHANEIVEFKKGYVFGEPVQYVRNRKGKKENISELVTILNDFMDMNNKSKQDAELAEWFYICGTAYRMVLPDLELYSEVPFAMDVLDPRNVFVVYHNGFGKPPVMSVQVSKNRDNKDLYSIYTKDFYFEIEDEVVIKEEPHALGFIPVIEYPANNHRLGAFEIVLDLLDSLNDLASNRMDGVEQFIQSFLKFINCQIDTEQFKELKENGAIMVKGEQGLPADVDVISSELNQSQTQILKDDIYQMVLIICGMPDRNGSNRTTGDTGQAVILRDGWSSAESRARDTELMFKAAERNFLKLVLRILKDSDTPLALGLMDIEVKFTRNKTDNLLVKTQGLQNMLESGIHPQIAIAFCNLFSDPEQVYLDSAPYLEKWLNILNITPPNNKPDPEGRVADEGSKM